MTDKYGKNLKKGDWVLIVSGEHLGRCFQIGREKDRYIFSNPGGFKLSNIDDFGKDGNMELLVKVDDPRRCRNINYSECAKAWKTIEIDKADVYYTIPKAALTDEQIAKLIYMGYDENERYECNVITMAEAGIDYYDVYDEAEEDSDSEECEYILHKLLKESAHYLVFASGCRWNGASGYMLTDDICQVIKRGYDVTVTPVAATPKGKVLVCRESSHDVPTGSTTIIIALTEREYERLKWADFEAVEKYANECCTRALRYA